MEVMMENLLIGVIYFIGVITLYYLISSKLLGELRSKKVIPHGTTHELEVMLKWLFIGLGIFGLVVVLINIDMLALLLITILVIFSLISKDIIESAMYYHFLVVTKAISHGEYVIMTRGIRGWIRRLTPLYVELSGEQGEIIRIPNKLVASEPIRIPAKALPLTIVIKLYLEKLDDIESLNKAVQEVVNFTKRHAIVPPRFRIRTITTNSVEYEITYGISNPESSNIIIKKVAQRLQQLFKEGVKFEVKREHSIINKL
ncbi:hypothetical protein EYM_03465 [Ignicoccus islandicus DSM 13165]|uniref:Small mechanosensitive ion channel protein MscS n=1 Tax=Ignicoccus islandicus DSM 13165 TaxID=940295 RepID=A0A0U2MAV9_9CREN|nr:mechanosensitive ion channel domain-containing protein [Ignicoccus islandicus]ALU12413.1 hypothetical protein EYM_03465 [Ignicoccus islandicus DSM 13165]